MRAPFWEQKIRCSPPSDRLPYYVKGWSFFIQESSPHKLNWASFRNQFKRIGSIVCCLGACFYFRSVKYQKYMVIFRSFANQRSEEKWTGPRDYDVKRSFPPTHNPRLTGSQKRAHPHGGPGVHTKNPTVGFKEGNAMPPPWTTAKLHFPVLQVDLFKRSGRPRSSERSRTILNPTRSRLRTFLKV